MNRSLTSGAKYLRARLSTVSGCFSDVGRHDDGKQVGVKDRSLEFGLHQMLPLRDQSLQQTIGPARAFDLVEKNEDLVDEERVEIALQAIWAGDGDVVLLVDDVTNLTSFTINALTLT
eukprot:m.205449 g.205449  ORF g.205449 m.205449 type:complete len:118 (-) comp15411_c1_seq2:35-388(-)